MNKIGKVQDIIKMFIKPCRLTYNNYDLGYSSQLGQDTFQIKSKQIHRQDLQIQVRNKINVKCSHYFHNKLSPCIIYLHTNGGSRIESLPIVNLICQYDISLFTFDFPGTGQSDGQYITLGLQESQDLKIIINYLNLKIGISKFVLWGRSMGAVSALLYCANNKINDIVACVYDSPFHDLRQLSMDYASNLSGVPKFMLYPLMCYLEYKIEQVAKFKVSEIKPIDCVKRIEVPGFFVTSFFDEFVKYEWVKRLYDNYGGQKELDKRLESDIINIVNYAVRKLWTHKLEQKISFRFDSIIQKKSFNTQPNMQSENTTPKKKENENKKYIILGGNSRNINRIQSCQSKKKNSKKKSNIKIKLNSKKTQKKQIKIQQINLNYI